MNNEDRIIAELLEIKERIDQMVTKEEISQLKAEMIQSNDDQTTILRRLDQERHFTLERVKRLEIDVEQIKLRLQIA